MAKRVLLELTPGEADVIARMMGAAEAGEVDGGPLDDSSPQRRAAVMRAFETLGRKLSVGIVTAKHKKKEPPPW